MTDIARMQDEQLGAAAAALARAFDDDPLMVFIEPDGPRRSSTLPIFMGVALRFGRPFGETYVTDIADGAAIWVPPGEEITEGGLAEAGIADAASALGEEAFGRFGLVLGTLEEIRKEKAPGPLWYLAILGVDPPRQGRGIGGELMAPVLDRADADGRDCYLDTMKERNVAFYKKHGFDVIVEDTFAHGPRFWSMLRRPR